MVPSPLMTAPAATMATPIPAMAAPTVPMAMAHPTAATTDSRLALIHWTTAPIPPWSAATTSRAAGASASPMATATRSV
jgi:hypothetical protein